MSIQQFSCPVLHETSTQLFEIKERPWWVALLQVFHLGRWFRYYSPDEKEYLEAKIESLSNPILTSKGSIIADVQAVKTLVSLNKACSLLTNIPEASALSSLSAKKIQEIVNKKNLGTPPQIFSEEVFAKDPTQAADSFLYCLKNFSQQEDIPAQTEFFVQQLFKLINPSKLTIRAGKDFFAAALAVPNWSREQKINFMKKIFLEQKRTQIEMNLLGDLASKATFTIEWIYNLDTKFMQAMKDHPSFEELFKRVNLIINNKDGCTLARASFLLCLYESFQLTAPALADRFSKSGWEKFLDFMSQNPELTAEAKSVIVQKLQTIFHKDPNLFFNSGKDYEAKKNILRQFLTDQETKKYPQIFQNTFPQEKEPALYLAKFYESLLNDNAIPLILKFYLYPHVRSSFPRPEAGEERWKKVIFSELVDSFSQSFPV